jgi:putative ABC transport system permease protein
VTGWTVVVRGVRHRAGRSAVVALLAAVAVAAAVLAPGFSRAAQQSVLTDGLASAPPVATGLTVSARGTAGSAPTAHELTGDARLVVDSSIGGLPALDRVLGPAVAGVDTDVLVSGGAEPVAARLAYRDRLCDQVRVVAGECPLEAGQVLISARTAEDYGLAPGDTVTVEHARTSQRMEVAGTYQPTDESAPYWGRSVYFTHGGFDPATGAPRTDAIFTRDETDLHADPDAVVGLSLFYPLDSHAVRLDDVPALRAQLQQLHNAVRIGDLELDTALPAILDGVAGDQDAIGRTAPIIAIPLLLLAWFVLFLLVSALTEERGREIALAKLRGFRAGRAARFGLGEVLLLIVVATPVGIALGLGLVELASRVALAEGTHMEIRPPVFVAAAVALGAVALAALLAGRATLRRPVLALLRRVPARGGWRAGVAEGVVVALAGASLFAALNDRAAPLALLAPALLAVVAGIVAARLVGAWSAVRLRLARRRGRIPAMLSAAQLSRRPGGRRIVVVVTVAVALLSFAATAWDVAAQARHDHAVDAVGADRVYSVTAEHPAALLAAVRSADPAGTSMAVVRSSGQYGGDPVELLGVEADRLAGLVQWRGYEAVASLAESLRPPVREPLRLSGDVLVRARVADLGPEPVRMSALVAVPGEPPRAVPLGTLEPGTAGYPADVPECAAGQCRLLGLAFGRAGAAGAFTASLVVEEIRSGGSALTAGLDEPGTWRAAGVGGGLDSVVASGSALRIEVARDVDGDLVVEHRDSADALPAALAGPPPADDPAAASFDFPGFGERPEPFLVVDTAPRLPRVGERGLLFDLEYAVRSAERTVALADSPLTYEVWAGPDAPADLAQRLTAAGVSVRSATSLDGTLDQLSRRAPALGLWLYLLAAGVAVALALGVVALSGRVGVEHRLYELAALRVAGVRAGLLRRALLREYAALLGWPLLIGFGTGVAAAALMLPGIALVEVGVLTAAPAYQPALGALPVAVVVTASGLLLAAVRALRLPHRARPERLREGWQ